ncbi:DUF924 family protein [Solimicrobium silvestre]|uniref:DUF924 domain-containing protein n=1 Tax=Solimicrobium silvestre TaxID=2099400 RepID=A0A2S9GZ81_9BURK|nr:DUF924 family protein [Solimicrobium silvestre]PRC93042.1 hypothetical protein S2091_2128 [Solimicrobium silvestre]
MSYHNIIRFWFEEIDTKQWYKKDLAFDLLLQQKFGQLHQSAIAGELEHWRANAQGRLAEIIILDQFSRNLGRNTPAAFTCDSLALCLAQHAVAVHADQELNPIQRAFIYMPFMHSESVLIHEQALQLFAQPGLENSLHFEQRHRDIILRFGRYPHRNAILGRVSTPEEIEFLEQPGSSF